MPCGGIAERVIFDDFCSLEPVIDAFHEVIAVLVGAAFFLCKDEADGIAAELGDLCLSFLCDPQSVGFADPGLVFWGEVEAGCIEDGSAAAVCESISGAPEPVC